MEKTASHLIACEAFQDALSWLKLGQRFPAVKTRFLPAFLHINPRELKRRLRAEIRRLSEKKSTAYCLYGQCFPDIDETLGKMGVPRLPCGHCYETLLGGDRYRGVVEEEPGSFFMEKELLVNFDKYCWLPLEFDDPQMRAWYFEHYRQIVYIRQPLDPDLLPHARDIAERLDLPLRIIEADYRELDKHLTDFLKRMEAL